MLTKAFYALQFKEVTLCLCMCVSACLYACIYVCRLDIAEWFSPVSFCLIQFSLVFITFVLSSFILFGSIQFDLLSSVWFYSGDVQTSIGILQNCGGFVSSSWKVFNLLWGLKPPWQSATSRSVKPPWRYVKPPWKCEVYWSIKLPGRASYYNSIFMNVQSRKSECLILKFSFLFFSR